MAECVALLRGINSGKNPMLRMDKLRELFEEIGFQNVSTVIASGNVLFDIPKNESFDRQRLEQKIEAAIQKNLGFISAVIIRTKSELQKLINTNYFKADVTSLKAKPHITFLQKPPVAETINSIPKKVEGYAIKKISEKEIIFVIDLSTAKTPNIMAMFEKALGKNITTRTLMTVEKILRKM